MLGVEKTVSKKVRKFNFMTSQKIRDLQTVTIKQ